MTPQQRAEAGRRADWLEAYGSVNDEVCATIALLRKIAAEPEGELVAWRYRATYPSEQWVSTWVVVNSSAKPVLSGNGTWEVQPLYTHPPQRQPLTEDQVWADDGIMSANAGAQLLMPCLMELVRAVERKHRIWEAP